MFLRRFAKVNKTIKFPLNQQSENISRARPSTMVLIKNYVVNDRLGSRKFKFLIFQRVFKLCVEKTIPMLRLTDRLARVGEAMR